MSFIPERPMMKEGSICTRELSSLGISYAPTEANFIYILIKDSIAVNNSLMKKGVIIRPMGPQAIRVTIGLPEENRRFIEALKEVISVSA